MTRDEIRIERLPGMTLHLRPGLDTAEAVEALRVPGETLKESRKSVTRRVGTWVVKESRGEGGLGAIKRTLLRRKYRQGWVAANYLSRRNVLVPMPHAFIEIGRFGCIAGNVLIIDYLDGFVSVEQFAKERLAGTGLKEDASKFLAALAQAIDGLCAAGAYHSDLSGKNIFTKDGESFYFIDLDGVSLQRPYTIRLRYKNHVQIYDSFCDFWDDDLLGPFLARMLPQDHAPDTWLEGVRREQRRRRARVVARWRREGRLEKWRD